MGNFKNILGVTEAEILKRIYFCVLKICKYKGVGPYLVVVVWDGTTGLTGSFEPAVYAAVQNSIWSLVVFRRNDSPSTLKKSGIILGFSEPSICQGR